MFIKRPINIYGQETNENEERREIWRRIVCLEHSDFRINPASKLKDKIHTGEPGGPISPMTPCKKKQTCL